MLGFHTLLLRPGHSRCSARGQSPSCPGQCAWSGCLARQRPATPSWAEIRSAPKLRRSSLALVLGQLSGADQFMPELLAKLSDSSGQIRQAALELLARLPAEGLAGCELFEPLVRCLADPDRFVRRAGLQLCGRLPDWARARLGPQIAGRLADEDPMARQQAGRLLVRLPGLSGLGQELGGLVRHPDWSTRRAALAGLGLLPTEELLDWIPVVEGALSDSEAIVRRAAVEALGMLPGPELGRVAGRLAGMLGESEPYVLEAVVRVLGELSEEQLQQAVPGLEKLPEVHAGVADSASESSEEPDGLQLESYKSIEQLVLVYRVAIKWLSAVRMPSVQLSSSHGYTAVELGFSDASSDEAGVGLPNK